MKDKFEPHWPKGLQAGTAYRLPCDDKGGSGGVWLQLIVASDGDVWVSMQDWEDVPNGQPDPLPSLRNCTAVGGGRRHRTHQALLNLAEAIMLDNKEHDIS